ncbi:MAG: LysE family transporter [Myroides sp.]|nr:LysE family transporter [Myroides sp.]
MLGDVLIAVPLGFLLAFTIGPVFFVLLETAVTRGFRAALAFDAGVIFADIIFILIAYFTTSSLLEQIKDDPKLFIVGGLIMIIYGYISYRQLKKNHQKHPSSGEESYIPIRPNYPSLVVKGFLLNFINIGVLGFWLGIIIVFAPRLDMDENRILVFFSAIVLAYLLVDCVKIFLAKQLKNRLTAHHIYKIKRIISIVLLAFGILLFLQGIFPKGKEQLTKQIDLISFTE